MSQPYTPGPIFNFIYHRLNHLCIFAFYSKIKESEDSAALIELSRIPLSSLFAVTEDAIHNAPPEEFGKYLSLVRSSCKNLGLFLMQSPTREQIEEYCDKLQDYVRMECPHVDADTLDIGELAAQIKSTMDRQRIDDPMTARVEASLLPIGDPYHRHLADAYNLYATGKPFGTLMRGLRKTFRLQYSLWNWHDVSRGFRYEEQRGPEALPDPEILGIQVTPPERPDEELRAIGKRIPAANFCRPAITVPEDTGCSICVGDVTIDPQGSEDSTKEKEMPVITACGHYFHLACLDAWTNDSAMRTSNQCPECRAEMCEARSRLSASLVEDARYVMDMDLQEGINDALVRRRRASVVSV
jgi:hypothetical protein